MHLVDNLEKPVATSVIDALTPNIGTFCARVVPIVDSTGRVFDHGLVVLHAGSVKSASAVPIDAVAAVIECHEDLTRDALQVSYARAEALKLAPKSSVRIHRDATTDMTTYVLVARRSGLNLEELGHEMARLNGTAASQQWPDSVGVLSKGLVQYLAFTPGAEHGGAYLLAHHDILEDSEPSPMTIVLTARATSDRTLDVLGSLLIARAGLFDPHAGVVDHRFPVAGVPMWGLPIVTYQSNLSNDLVPVVREQEVAARLNVEAYRITSGGKVLAIVQFFDRQDGGVIVVRGNFPIELILIFMSMVSPNLKHSRLGYMPSADASTSYLLPITRHDFVRGLQMMDQRTSNLKIERDTSRFIIQQIGNEGSASPFVARMMAGLLEVRGWTITKDPARKAFDDYFDSLLANLRDAREAKREVDSTWAAHRDAVESGRIIRVEGTRVYVLESIDRAINRELGSFLLASTRALKNSLQKLTAHLGVDIGFMFQKQAAYAVGLAAMQCLHPALAAYIEIARRWTWPLIKARNDLEHQLVPAPKVAYEIHDMPVRASEPIFESLPLTEYLSTTFERVLLFVEEVTVHVLASKLPPTMEVAEIPRGNRDSNYPRRFVLTISDGGRAPWRLPPRAALFSAV